MINKTSIKNIANGINLHLVHSDKFKTVLFGLYIKRPLDNNEVSANALLSRIMDKATQSYASPMEMNKALEELYGSVMVADVHKYGEKQMIQLKLQVPGQKYVGDQTLFDSAVKLLNEVVNSPKVINEGFDPSIFEQEKNGLISEVEMRSDDKNSWVLSRCIEQMCANEPYRIHEFGTIDQIKAITPKSLLLHHQHILATSEIDICVIGDFDDQEMIELFNKHFEFKRENLVIVEREKIEVHPKNVNHYEEKHDLTQGRLAIGYRMNIPYESPQYLAAFLGSVVLGYGGSSRLFKVVREREGLSYSTYARAEKFKSIMLVYAGVDIENFSKAEKLIEQQIKEMQEGLISDEEIIIAKKTLVSNLKSISDYPNSYINYYYNQYITEGFSDIDAYISNVEALTKEEVVNALKCFELDTVVRLTKEDSNAL